MKKRYLQLLFFAFLLFSTTSFLLAQELFIPIEFQKAYENGTRSKDGKPGPNFWKNHATYDIEIEISPEDRTLKGKETIVYQNNSPSALNSMVVSLLYDVTKKGNIRDEAISEKLLGEGVVFGDFQVNGTSIDLTNWREARRSGTNLYVFLSDAIKPGATVELYIEWEENITSDLGRIGFVDETSSFVGYWYPKVAVYDDIDGWDTNSFLGNAEFYSDLSDMDVKIKIPTSYTVWATGTLENADQVLPQKQLELYQKAGDSDETITIIGKEDREAGIEMKSDTWHYKAQNVPDFAFAFSDHFYWECSRLQLEEKKVRVHSVFPEVSAKACEKITSYQKQIMKFFSEELPGIPYPYPEFTSFYKPYPAGGMEFPMMANNGTPRSERGLISLTAHEMYHMYKPFYLRTNEEKYAWMDEGWADFMDLAALNYIKGGSASVNAQTSQKLFLERTMGTLANLPLISSSADLSSGQYGYHAYSHPKFIYELLQETLGEELFKKCLQGYMKRWAYKAPSPYDFFFSFNDISGQDLNWFWNPWFIEFGYPDLGIQEVTEKGIEIVRKGSKPISIDLIIIYENGDTVKFRESPAIWKSGAKTATVKVERQEKPAKVLLNTLLPDLDKSDNVYLSNSQISETQLKEYEGEYELTGNGLFRIKASKQSLIGYSTSSGNNYLLVPTEEDIFSTIDGTFTITFSRKDDGTVEAYEGTRFGRSFGRKLYKLSKP